MAASIAEKNGYASAADLPVPCDILTLPQYVPNYRAGVQSSSNKPAPKSTPSQPASSGASNPADPAPAFGEAQASSYVATKAARDEIAQMLAQNLAGYSPDSAILSGVAISRPFAGGLGTSWQGELAQWIYGNQSSWTGKSALWMLQHADAIVSTLQSMAELIDMVDSHGKTTLGYQGVTVTHRNVDGVVIDVTHPLGNASR